MAVEPDTPPPANTFRFMLWNTVQSLSYLRAYWGRRLLGGALGLIADLLAEGASQAFYSHLPGHPQQATDSLEQTGKDRDLYRFRGESNAAFALRQRGIWSDSRQAGTVPQVLNVINQWGNAGWPYSWVNLTASNLVESSDPTVFTFTLTIPFGNITPPWIPWLIGSGPHIGDPGLYIGIGPSTDIPTMLYIVRKWKPSRSKGFVAVFYDGSHSVTFTV